MNDKLHTKEIMLSILHTPPLFDVELSSHCNIRCIFCPRDIIEKENRTGLMNINTINRLIEWLPNSGNIILSGLGEPLLNKHIYYFIRSVKEKGLGISIITNGSLLSKNVAINLINAGIDEIQISFHHLIPEKFMEIEVDADFNKILQNIKDLSELNKDKKIRLRLNVIIFEKNKDVLRDFENFARLYNFTLFVRKIHNRGGFSQYSENKKVFLGCGIFPKVHFIKYDGSVLPCVNDVLGRYTIGNVWENSFNDILKIKKKLIEKSWKNLFPICKICNDDYREYILIKRGEI